MISYRNFGYSRFVLIVSVAFFVFGVVGAAKTLDSRWSGSTGIITKSFLSKPPTSPSSSNDRPGNGINVSSLQDSSRGERTYDARSMASVLDPNRQGADSQAQFSLANTQASLAPNQRKYQVASEAFEAEAWDKSEWNMWMKYPTR
ncbi:MAG: hypothetical protein QOH96_3705 [Blastocatellia bacterium]|jgi:hypothetical protein|nr:hypothetical protein [Blastocatellia bacterium]